MTAHPDFPEITVRAVVKIARMPGPRRARALERLVRRRMTAVIVAYAKADRAKEERRIIYGDAMLDEPLGIINYSARAGR